MNIARSRYELHSKVESLFDLIRLTVRLIAVTILLMLLHFLKYGSLL